MVDFSDILNKRVEDIESPKPLPPGTYRGMITAPPAMDEFERKEENGSTTKIPVAVLSIAIQEPTDGVDEDLLAQAGGVRARNGKPKEVQMRYYLEEESLHRVKKLLRSCGIEAASLGEGFQELAGREVLVDLQVQPGRNDPDETYQRVVKVVGTAS